MIKLAQETQELVNQLIEKWDQIKKDYSVQPEYGSERDTVIGKLWWDNPDLIFVLVTDREEGYEGSQAQIGITKDGRIQWEYQSHCSCNGYEDSKGEGTEFDLSKKSYELDTIPLDWEEQIRTNIKKLLCIK